MRSAARLGDPEQASHVPSSLGRSSGAFAPCGRPGASSGSRSRSARSRSSAALAAPGPPPDGDPAGTAGPPRRSGSRGSSSRPPRADFGSRPRDPASTPTWRGAALMPGEQARCSSLAKGVQASVACFVGTAQAVVLRPGRPGARAAGSGLVGPPCRRRSPALPCGPCFSCSPWGARLRSAAPGPNSPSPLQPLLPSRRSLLASLGPGAAGSRKMPGPELARAEQPPPLALRPLHSKAAGASLRASTGPRRGGGCPCASGHLSPAASWPRPSSSPTADAQPNSPPAGQSPPVTVEKEIEVLEDAMPKAVVDLSGEYGELLGGVRGDKVQEECLASLAS